MGSGLSFLGGVVVGAILMCCATYNDWGPREFFPRLVGYGLAWGVFCGLMSS